MRISKPLIVTFGTTPAIARSMRFGHLVVDGVNRAKRVRDYAAGKSVNAARAARTVRDVDVVCVSTIGRRDRRFAELLEAESLQHELVTVEPPTRLVVTAIDEAAGTATELIEDTAAVDANVGDDLLRSLQARMTHAAVVVMSGSLARGLPTDLYARCIAAAGGRPTILDASGTPLTLAIDARPTIIKVNAGELSSVATGDTREAALRLAERTGGWIIVTRGPQPTIAVHAVDGQFEVAVPKVERVASAIGSGDSFAGGLAASIAVGEPMQRALAIASACATANVLTDDAAHFDRETVERLVTEVRVTKLGE